MLNVAKAIEFYRRRGEDRVNVIDHPKGKVIVLADGAGGTSGGAEAADTVTAWTKAYVDRAKDIAPASQWGELLARIDRQIQFENGQSTAVIVAVTEEGVSGASVGDSAAWIVGEENLDDLTVAQIRKPLLGTGAAKPLTFERNAFIGTILVASDGLVKYAPYARICEIARWPNLPEAAKALIDLVRLKSGSLQDDTAVLLCRCTERVNA